MSFSLPLSPPLSGPVIQCKVDLSDGRTKQMIEWSCAGAAPVGVIIFLALVHDRHHILRMS